MVSCLCVLALWLTAVFSTVISWIERNHSSSPPATLRRMTGCLNRWIVTIGVKSKIKTKFMLKNKKTYALQNRPFQFDCWLVALNFHFQLNFPFIYWSIQISTQSLTCTVLSLISLGKWPLRTFFLRSSDQAGFDFIIVNPSWGLNLAVKSHSAEPDLHRCKE